MVQFPFASGVRSDSWYPCMGKQVLSFPGASGIFRDGESHKDFLTQVIMIFFFFQKELKTQGKVVVSDFVLPQNSG